jgi:hypothetical protein
MTTADASTSRTGTPNATADAPEVTAELKFPSDTVDGDSFDGTTLAGKDAETANAERPSVSLRRSAVSPGEDPAEGA